MFAIKEAKTGIKTMICSAIRSRHLMEFYYHGGVRLVEPFCYGEIAPGDNEVLECYQVSGYSEFGEPIGWKLFRVSEVSSLEIAGEQFTGVRPEYDPYSSVMTTIYCCVSMDEEGESTLEKPVKLAQDIDQETPTFSSQEEYLSPFQRHNKRMRTFRISHPFPYRVS